ncbi:MAG: DUF4129 domain-containing transglutaminase family protein [Planctomycetota bacterium]
MIGHSAAQIQAPTGLRRSASLTLFTASVLALANLPQQELPLLWLLAFTLPGAALGFWARLAQAPWRRALLASLMQAGACYAALVWAGPMTRPAALACTILPPLAFSTARNHDSDPTLALFLGFCVMLVGCILDGIHVPLLLGYVVASFLTLHFTTLLEGHRASHVEKPPRITQATDIAATSLMLLSCLLLVFAIDRTLSLLPSPSMQKEQAAASAPAGQASPSREIGLDDQFLLDGASGTLGQLNSEELVRAAPLGRFEIPPDMYLRCGFFTKPTLGEWHVGKLALQTLPAGAIVFREPDPGSTKRRIAIERLAGAQQYVFLPQNFSSISGIEDLSVDMRRGWVRPNTPNDTIYEALYEVRRTTRSLQVDPNGRRLGLLDGLPGYDIAPLERLMDKWRVGFSPDQAMQAIAEGLAKHCLYEQREPTGPYAHALENFLFAPEDRHGYCMHFASAAALMLRLRGIPCRVAVGLHGGAPDGGEGGRIYGSKNAHAWVEVLARDEGYRIFDPTPPDLRGQGFLPIDQLNDSADPDAEEGDEFALPTLERIREIVTMPWFWAVSLAIAIVIALIPRRAREPLPIAATQATPELRRALQRVLRALARAGHTRPPRQTLEQFAERLAGQEQLPDEVASAFAAYQEVRFGGEPFGAQRIQRLRHGVRAAEQMRRDSADASR